MCYGFYLSIPKVLWCNRSRFGMDKWFHPTFYNGCNYLFMLIFCFIIAMCWFTFLWHVLTILRSPSHVSFPVSFKGDPPPPPPPDDVIKWKHVPRRYWPFVCGIPRSPVNSPHKGQWRGALMFSLICVWINGWVNNREAGDLTGYRAHYDVSVMPVACDGHFGKC